MKLAPRFPSTFTASPVGSPQAVHCRPAVATPMVRMSSRVAKVSSPLSASFQPCETAEAWMPARLGGLSPRK